MNYAQLFFDKENISLLAINDIEKFFESEVEESDKLELKAYVLNEKEQGGQNSKEKGILKTISAFLNSEGGILIWGAPKGQKAEGKRNAVFKGDLTPLDHKYEKDEFIAKVANRITPSPLGIKFHAFEKHAKYIYVIEVPKSDYPPHQFENVYYMRLDGQTIAAPHTYIEALFKKITFPIIEGYIELKKLTREGEDYYLDIASYFFNQTPFQNDYNLSYRIVCSNGKFQNWDKPVVNFKTSYANQGHEIRVDNAKEFLHFGETCLFNNTIIFGAEDLYNDNYKVSLILAFGAKLSPMKFSEYKLEIGLSKSTDVNECVKQRNENIYSHEIRSQSGLSNNEIVKKIIGRK